MNLPGIISDSASSNVPSLADAAMPTADAAPSQPATKHAARVAADQPSGPPNGRPPKRTRAEDEASAEGQEAIEDNIRSVAQRMEQLNEQQERMALMTANMQMQATSRSEMLQLVRDMCKDLKDSVKDVGDAGHKPC